jgi:hypothetical protein
MNTPIPPVIQPDLLLTNLRSDKIYTDSIISNIQTGSQFIDLSVNVAYVKAILNGYPMLQTTIYVNTPGSFNGPGTGNKSILGLNAYNYTPLSDFQNIEIVFDNVQGTVSPLYGPSGTIGSVNQAPYVNVVMDLGINGVYIIDICTDSLDSRISTRVGKYETVGTDLYKVSWNPQDFGVLVVGVGASEGYKIGNISPIYTIGPNWFQTVWSFLDIVNANPGAQIVNVNSNDNGMPIGSRTAGIMINSGDASQQVFSSKIITNLKINNQILIE